MNSTGDLHRYLCSSLLNSSELHRLVIRYLFEWLHTYANAVLQLCEESKFAIVSVGQGAYPRHPALLVDYGNSPPAISYHQHHDKLKWLARSVFITTGIPEVIVISRGHGGIRAVSWWDAQRQEVQTEFRERVTL